jgi:DNA-directed RNA polymerase specialized sigma24 family protein
MSDEPIDRAQWRATYIMPIEPESRGWLRRVAPAGLEVDDVIQEAYKILAGLADVSRIANPRAYFYQVIKSVISEHLRRASVARGAVASPQILPEQEGLTPERIVSGREDLGRLYRAITRLPEGSCGAQQERAPTRAGPTSYASSVHSHTLPIRSYRPKGFGG